MDVDIIKKLIFANMKTSPSDIIGYDFISIIAYDIGFLSVVYKKDECNQEKIIEALYKQMIKHKGFKLENIDPFNKDIYK